MNAPKDREVKFPLVENTNKQFSLFGVEQYMWDSVAVELAGRMEKQKIEIEYDRNEIKRLQEHYRISGGKQVEPDLSPMMKRLMPIPARLTGSSTLTISFRLLPRTMNACQRQWSCIITGSILLLIRLNTAIKT